MGHRVGTIERALMVCYSLDHFPAFCRFLSENMQIGWGLASSPLLASESCRLLAACDCLPFQKVATTDPQ